VGEQVRKAVREPVHKSVREQALEPVHKTDWETAMAEGRQTSGEGTAASDCGPYSGPMTAAPTAQSARHDQRSAEEILKRRSDRIPIDGQMLLLQKGFAVASPF